MKTFTITESLREQMVADSIKGIHIRDAISVDILPSGEYTTDWDGIEGQKIELKDEYVEKISHGLDNWFNSLRSDGDWYKNIDGDFINIHGEMVEDLA